MRGVETRLPVGDTVPAEAVQHCRCQSRAYEPPTSESFTQQYAIPETVWAAIDKTVEGHTLTEAQLAEHMREIHAVYQASARGGSASFSCAFYCTRSPQITFTHPAGGCEQ